MSVLRRFGFFYNSTNFNISNLFQESQTATSLISIYWSSSSGGKKEKKVVKPCLNVLSPSLISQRVS